MNPATLDFTRDGVELHPAALDAEAVARLRGLADQVMDGQPGSRLTGHDDLSDVVRAQGPLGQIAVKLLGPEARPVRAVLFDKTPASNWAVGWHQDRTIAVDARERPEAFAPWSTKAGVTHATPPFDLLASMVTLRAHLDEAAEENAPLLVALGSHNLGAVSADAARRTAEEREIIACTARTGDVWAYSTAILHASRRSSRPARRRVLQVDYAAVSLPEGLEWAGV